MARFREYMKRVVDMGLHEKVAILAGVGPLKSSGAARYMRDKVPGMMVDDYYVDEMVKAIQGIPKEERAARSEAWRARGIELCIEQIQEIQEDRGCGRRAHHGHRMGRGSQAHCGRGWIVTTSDFC